MATRSFVIRSSPPLPSASPRLGHPNADDEVQAWEARTGDVLARNQANLSRTRFVRESKASQQWSGRTDQPATESRPLPLKSLEDDSSPLVEVSDTVSFGESVALNTGPEQHAAPAQISGGQSMASLYAQLAPTLGKGIPTARLKGDSKAPSSMAAAEPPHKKRKQTKNVPDSSDWFIAKARKQMFQNEERKREELIRQQQQAVQSPVPDSVPSTSEIAAESPTTVDSSQAGPSHQACPACHALLPLPCSASTLRQHLTSIAHRIAVATPPAPAFVSDTRGNKTSHKSIQKQTQSQDAKNAALPKLHIDATNRGYHLLSGMGWKEGWGVGKDEWEWLQKHSTSQRNSDEGDQAEVLLVVSSDEDEKDGKEDMEEIDLFDRCSPTPPPPPPQSARSDRHQDNVSAASGATEENTVAEHDVEDAASISPAADEKEEGKRRKPARLVPIEVQLKNDRLGLGRRAPRGHSSASVRNDTAQRNGESTAKGDAKPNSIQTAKPMKRRDHVRKHEEERRQWLALRESLR